MAHDERDPAHKAAHKAAAAELEPLLRQLAALCQKHNINLNAVIDLGNNECHGIAAVVCRRPSDKFQFIHEMSERFFIKGLRKSFDQVMQETIAEGPAGFSGEKKEAN